MSGAYAGGSNPNSTLDNVGLFTNFRSGYYWSGLEYTPDTGGAWYFNVNVGYQGAHRKDFGLYAWAVRPAMSPPCRSRRR